MVHGGHNHIPKSNSQDIPLNFKGISLLCTSAKILLLLLKSSILNKRLVTYLEEKVVLVDEQNGFRADRSCEYHVFSLTNIIRYRLIGNKDKFTLFIDIQKAFDFVNR